MKSFTITLLIAGIAASGYASGVFADSPANATIIPTQADKLTDSLLRSMPMADRTMYDRTFMMRNVESSLRARSEMAWGSAIPDSIFRHYVLPVRVDDESLDMSRPMFYNELKSLVQSKTMEEAILTVNHWCHGKASYAPSDSRTRSPLSTMRNATGRSGELAVFTVAALRSVGIPARLVYTPAWAHTDGNHAWVEAWANGNWHFIGACEPEPVLDSAWFNRDASQAIAVLTDVYGDYDGPEQVMEHDGDRTVLNLTGNYANAAKLKAVVKTADGKRAANVPVRFLIYNNAGFQPFATVMTNDKGEAQVTAGLGDIVAWASDGKMFGLSPLNWREKADIVMDKDGKFYGSVDWDINAPIASKKNPTARKREYHESDRPFQKIKDAISARKGEMTEAQIAENEKLTAYDDSIRRAYIRTFADSASVNQLNDKLNVDYTRLYGIMTDARGNHDTIGGFILAQSSATLGKAMQLLGVINAKDRSDVTRDVLDDHLATPDMTRTGYEEYILSPRVERETLTPFRKFFNSIFTPAERDAFRENPAAWAGKLAQHVKIEGDTDGLRMSPRAVWESGRADRLSAGICFVAGARSFGIPSRIDPVTGRVQYADTADNWIDVTLSPEVKTAPARTGELRAARIQTSMEKNPEYYTNFSISRIQDGYPRQLEYPEGMTLEAFLKTKPRLEAGQYMLTTGQRLPNGRTLVRNVFFTVAPNSLTGIPFSFPHP